MVRLKNRELIRINEQTLMDIGALCVEYNVINDEIKAYLEKCYQNDELLDTEVIEKLIAQQLMKEANQWRVRKND